MCILNCPRETYTEKTFCIIGPSTRLKGNCQGDNIKGKDLSGLQIVLCSPEEEKEGGGYFSIPL